MCWSASTQAGNLAQANAQAALASEIMSVGYVGDIFELKGDAQQGGSFLSMLVPLGAAAKGLGTAGKVARGVKAADATVDAVRAADVVGDAGTAAHTAEAASDAKKGVHVKPVSALRRAEDVLGKTEGGPGKWEKSPRRTKGQEYQEQISGVERGAEYKVDDVLFDGYDANRNVLLYAKDWKKFPPADKNFWHAGTEKEAISQIRAANGTPVEWHFSTPEAKNAVDALFKRREISGIKTIFTP